MTALHFISIVGFLLLANSASAEKCEDEISHLREFGVHYIPKPLKENSSFRYEPVAGSNMVLAIEKDVVDRTKIDSVKTSDGYAFVARGMIVGISGEFDKNGKCLNAITFEYDVMTNDLPNDISKMPLTFNYNFQVCQNVDAILQRNSATINLENPEAIAKDLKKKNLAAYNELVKLTELAAKNKFHKIARPTPAWLLLKCVTAINNRKTSNEQGSLPPAKNVR